MPYLTYTFEKDAVPIAIVKNGKKYDKYVYLSQNDPNKQQNTPQLPSIELDLSDINLKHALKGLKPAQQTKLLQKMALALNKDADDLYDEADIYNNVYKNMKQKQHNILTLNDNRTFSIMPTTEKGKSDVIFATGMGGSGKSYIALQYAQVYNLLHPKNKIYLISKLEHDETLDKLGKKLKRIDIMDFLKHYKEMPSIEEFAGKKLKDGSYQGSLIIFDDYDSFSEVEIEDEKTGKMKKVNLLKQIQKLIDDLLTMHRHYNISVIICSHFSSNFKATRLIFNEATHLVMFANGCSPHALQYVMKTYGGLDSKQLQEVKALNSRWFCLRKNFPNSIISEKCIKLLINT